MVRQKHMLWPSGQRMRERGRPSESSLPTQSRQMSRSQTWPSHIQRRVPGRIRSPQGPLQRSWKPPRPLRTGAGTRKWPRVHRNLTSWGALDAVT